MNEKAVREAIALWKQEAVRRTAERLREEGLAILEGHERDRLDTCADGRDDHPGFELEALLRTALELDPDGPRARAEAALSGQPQARREILEPLAGFAEAVLSPADETGRAEVRQALPLFVEGLIEIIEAKQRLWRGDVSAHVAASQPLPAAAPGGWPSAAPRTAAVPGADAAMALGPVTSDTTSDAACDSVAAMPAAIATCAAATSMPPAAVTRDDTRDGAASRPGAAGAAADAVDPRPFLTAWDDFIYDKVDRTGEFSASRRPEFESTCSLFKWLCGDVRVGQLSRALFQTWKDLYLDLPYGYRTVPRWREMRVDQLVEVMALRGLLRQLPGKHGAGAKQRYKRLSPKTFNKHLANMRAYADWLEKREQAPAGSRALLKQLDAKVKKKKGSASSERLAYTAEAARRTFHGPVHMGRLSAYFLSRPGTVVVRDSLYWIPLMAAFHGLRREEAAQLRVRNVRQEFGIWFFDLNDPELNLKAADCAEDDGSRRFVPLHRDFLRLGFLEDRVVDRDPSALLFPELSNDNAHGSYGDKLGKRFGNYLVSAGLVPEGEERGLHRFRHLFITHLNNAVSNIALVEALTGHASEGRSAESRRYTKEMFIPKLKETIDLLELPIDVDALVAAHQRSRRVARKS
ncbi:MAG: tyrosine-type recombinase/integrase [Salinarimonas sp.]